MRMRCGLLLGVLLLLLTAACGTPPTTETVASGEPASQNGVEALDYTVSAAATGLYLRINTRVNFGAIGFTVTDPNGTLRWDERIAADAPVMEDGDVDNLDRLNYSQERYLAPIPGEWHVVLIFENATGAYEVVWRVVGE